MTTKTTAPPGRVYRIDRKATPSDGLMMCQVEYERREKRPAQWARVNPADFDRFADLWPGCVVAEDAQLRGTVRLGRD